MVEKNQKRILILFAALLLSALPLSAQVASGQTDSLVRLLNAKYLEQVETNGRMARKAIEPTFLHNGTYLSCDTALWHVEEKIINCFGHVQLMQGESVLTSEKLDYMIEENLAQFRGSVVQLRNKKENILRTRILDYNTQDSLAVFRGGASMKSEDGQIIESDEGTYSNARSFFTFRGNVNMFTDSVFVKTNALDYDSDRERADFLSDIDFWRDGDMLSAGTGWYERNRELFFFRNDVHGLGSTQESWSDSLYFYRSLNNVLMRGNIQIQDQSRNVAAMGDFLEYIDSTSCVTLEKRASAALWDSEGETRDTTYLGATRFVYDTRKHCDIDPDEITTASSRLSDILGDPILEYRRRAAQQAAEAAAQALRDDPNAGPRAARPAAQNAAAVPRPGGGLEKGAAVPEEKPGPEMLEKAAPPQDSLALAAPADSLLQAQDSLAVEPVDTTKVGFLLAVGDVRVFRKDMQMRCDSLRYTDLDSIARLYKDPVVWNEGNRQYNSDSLFVLIREGKMERANLLSNAFIHTDEGDDCFDQIKSTDVIAYFNDSTALRRFDALGGVNALFFLEENATVNKTESKMMMATFEGGEVQYVYNFDSPKNDVYPIVQMPEAERRLKGFNWQPERRPQDKYDVTSMVVKPSERAEYEARPRAKFPQTETYFPGHMKELYAALEEARVRRQASREQRDAAAEPADSLAPALPDSLAAVPADSLVLRPAPADSLGAQPADSLKLSRPETGAAPADTTEYMSDRELRRSMRIARRDARWAELDAKDAAKAARKEARKAERQARRDARRAKRAERQAAIDEAKLQKYIERYQKQKERNERKQKPVPAGERPPGTETGGELPAAAESE